MRRRRWRQRAAGAIHALVFAVFLIVTMSLSGAQEGRYMVAAANPHATFAGIEIPAWGGSAVDAALAAQTVLGQLGPQSSGFGGSAFMLRYDAEARKVRVCDGRETAPATSHFSIVDAEGNAVSMTTSIESAFGAHLMASGFLLNNRLADFSFTAGKDGALVANRVEGGKRPGSSMSPAIVLDTDGHLIAALGSPGGSRIIGCVAKSLVAVLDWQLTIQEAVALPHHINRNGVTDLEEDTPIIALERQLQAIGHKTGVRAMTSGLHGSTVRNGRLDSGADSRREDVVLQGVARF